MNTKAAAHTPTPWTAHEHWVSLPGLARGINANSKANAAFIVRACNAHEDLIAALEMVRDHIHESASDKARFVLGPNDNAEQYITAAGELIEYRTLRAALAKAGAA